MIVILQSVQVVLHRLKRQIGEREGIHYTDSHREALDLIRDNEPMLARTVVIMSDHYPNEFVNGSILAAGVKGMRPDAWCLLYTSERPCPGPSVDGVIDKLDSALPMDAVRRLVNAGIDDPEKFPTLESLYEAFPWIQRPSH